MNTKELKTNAEAKIKEIVKEFSKTTGLDLSYIKVEKEKPTEFVNTLEDTKISIILE